MALTTLEPNPAWAEGAHEETVDVLAAHAEDLDFKVWAGDWCPDCRSQLPDFAAALAAASVPEDSVHQYELDTDKQGPGVEEYDIELIPTVVVEHGGEEVCRFVESEGTPIAVYLAEQLKVELGD
jgi:thiol-disulfide isomerase/thioredoxin